MPAEFITTKYSFELADARISELEIPHVDFKFYKRFGKTTLKIVQTGLMVCNQANCDALRDMVNDVGGAGHGLTVENEGLWSFSDCAVRAVQLPRYIGKAVVDGELKPVGEYAIHYETNITTLT